MQVIGNTIARLRRERRMTQEALAEVLGVSAPTVSKWENSTTCPDIALLPVIADVFGVSIDALFGRNGVSRPIEPEDMYDVGMDELLHLIARTGKNVGAAWTVEQFCKEYTQYAKERPEMHSLALRGPGVFYMRQAMGAMLLKRPEEGWRSLLTDEGGVHVMRMLADDDFRWGLAAIFERKMKTFTLSSLTKYSGVQDAARVTDLLVRCDFARERTLEADGQEVRYFEMVGTHRLSMLFAVLACAKEFAEWQDVCWCHFGSADWYQK